MTARVRVVKLIVQPVVVLDDGLHLTELHADPLTVLPAELDAFPEMFAKELAEQEAKINAERTP